MGGTSEREAQNSDLGRQGGNQDTNQRPGGREDVKKRGSRKWGGTEQEAIFTKFGQPVSSIPAAR